LLAYSAAGDGSHLWRPGRRHGVIREFDDPQRRSGEGIVKGGEIRVFLGGGGRVFRSQCLMHGLEIDVNIDAGFVVLGIAELAGNDGSWKAGLVRDEGVSLGQWQGAGSRALCFRRGSTRRLNRLLTTSNHLEVRRDGDIDGGG